MEKLLVKVLKQLVLGPSAHKWWAWDLNLGPSVPEFTFFPPGLVVFGMVTFAVLKAKFMVQRRNSAQLNTQLLHNTNCAQRTQVEHIKIPGPTLIVKFIVSKGFASTISVRSWPC